MFNFKNFSIAGSGSFVNTVLQKYFNFDFKFCNKNMIIKFVHHIIIRKRKKLTFSTTIWFSFQANSVHENFLFSLYQKSKPNHKILKNIPEKFFLNEKRFWIPNLFSRFSGTNPNSFGTMFPKFSVAMRPHFLFKSINAVLQESIFLFRW